jgi:hypothetical protein
MINSTSFSPIPLSTPTRSPTGTSGQNTSELGGMEDYADPPRTIDYYLVTAPPASTPPRGAYGNLTGAQENSRRNEEWAAMSPAERAISLGLLPYAEPGEDLGASVLYDDDGWGFTEISYLQQAGLLPPTLETAAMNALLEAAREELPNSIENAIVGRAAESAVRRQMSLEGWTELGQQIRVLVPGPENSFTLRIYDYLALDPSGSLQFLEVKANGGTRNARQLLADSSIAQNGGVIVSRSAGLVGLPFGTRIGPTAVGVVQVQINRSY